MSDKPGEPAGRPEVPAGQGYRIVHLRRAEYEDAAVRARWQADGYSTLGPVEGHDPHVRCPICSTDEPKPDCPVCGQGPCVLINLILGTD